MATLAQIYNVWAASGELPGRFVGACLKAAYAIVNEDPGTANHANRLAWANVVIGGDEAAVRAKATAHLRYAIASNATLQSSGEASTDNDIEYIVNSQINILAGA